MDPNPIQINVLIKFNNRTSSEHVDVKFAFDFICHFPQNLECVWVRIKKNYLAHFLWGK